MVPKSQRRHRIHGSELPFAEEDLYLGLLRRLEERENLMGAQRVFRLWFRIHHYVRNKPSYPSHGTWSEISSYLTYGTVSGEEAT